MTEGMQTLAMSLQAQAQNKALAKARQAQQLQAGPRGREAARVMGAIAPHRAATRCRAVGGGAQGSWASGISGMGSSQDALHGFGSGTSDAQYSVLPPVPPASPAPAVPSMPRGAACRDRRGGGRCCGAGGRR